MYASSADLDVVDDGDGSIYNGDENHKVWTGSQDRLDAIDNESPYDFYSSGGGGHSGTGGGGGGSSTIGRTPRARQISAPVPVPSPPKEELSKKQLQQLRKAPKPSPSGHRPMLGTQSLSGTLIRPKPVHAGTLMRAGPPPPPNGLIYAGPGGVPMMAAGPPMPPQRQFHTFSHRGYMAAHGHHNGGGGYPPMPMAAMHHHMQHAPPPPSHHHQHHAALVHHHHHNNGGGGGGGGPPMMTAAAAFMMPQQYATLQNPRHSSNTASKKKNKKDKGMMMNGGGGIPLGMPVQPPAMYAYPSSLIGEPRPLGMSSRKLAQSAAAGLDDSGNSGAESPGGTGIYRRKGHLNERAFSYSIRQEHRSRSHGSLASLQFNPPDLKKEREIAQMVAALDLNAGGGGGVDEAAMSGIGGGSSLGGGGGAGGQHHHHHHHHHQGHSVLANGGTGTFGKPRR